MDQISSAIDKCFSSLITDTDVKNVNDRKEEFNKFKNTGIPSNKYENWKYSSLIKDINNFSDLTISKKKQNVNLKKNLFDFNHDKIFLVDGILFDADVNEKGLKISQYNNFKKIGNNNPLVYLNNAFACNGFELEVKENFKVKKPLVIYNYFTNQLPSTFINFQHKLILNSNSELVVFINNIFQTNSKFFCNNVTNIELKDGAILKNYSTHENNKSSSLFNFYNVDLGYSSNFEYFNYINNTSSCRDEININLNGENAFASLANLQNLDQKYNHESKWVINHNKENTKSSQFLKTALHDSSHSVFQGKIYVNSIAQKTDGYQLSRALLLSDLAKFTAKPELEIYADDVKCSHGSSSGSIDEDSLFYLRSRGIDEKDAKKMMIEGFLAEAVQKITDKNFQQLFLNKLALTNEY
ncbi:MAG: Fe-S cluster assembly protein SufD [Candidatus Pelagibacter sp.]|nr:Fe-S cluster assembly protein SufD [Candidatus Pelagibacter sp.]|tara:strand:- start:15335 stop:16570 length:1236 start_codon:yes stop_codon:yes gene_type:complete